MGNYFSHLTKEEEKKISAALWRKYGPMTLSEMNDDLLGIRFKPRYVDPQPADFDGEKIDMIGLDEEGNWASADKIDKHWKLKSNKMDKWAQALQAAESVIEDNLTHVNKVTIWLVGGAVVGGKAKDHVSLNAKLEYDDGGEEKVYYDIPEAMLEELDTEKAMMGYAVEYLINHFILTQYFAKFDS